MSQSTTTSEHGTAAPHAAQDTHASTAADGGHQGGLPQLNTHDFAPQLVWLAITFGALYWIMSRIALPRIGEALEKRRDQIASDIDNAKRLQQDAEAAEAAYETALAEAKAKAHGIAQETRDSLNASTEARRKEVEDQINAKLQEAEERIGAAKQSAMSEVSAIATQTTKEIVDRLIGGDVPESDISGAVDAALKH
jgi:F-type H+-transporting ATPase subunit b